MPNNNKKPKLNSTKSPNRVKTQLQNPNFENPNSKRQTTIKTTKYRKRQIEFYQKPK
jgi:hypothetical protein